MHPLYQRLRELDWDSFQRLTFQLLAERHPGLKIRHVEGAGGDRGLDLFEGELKTQPTIWQVKHFPNGLGPRQRPQVRESLKAALKYFKPIQWILVVSVDLDRKGHEWFQKLQRSYSDKAAIGLFQASDIVRELISRRNIRDVFFPGALIDTIAVRRAIKDMGEIETEDLENQAKESLDELLARLEEADARFNYQIVYAPNAGPDIVEVAPEHPLLIASVFKDERRIDVFARDLDALRLDPPKVHFSVKGTGVTKFQEFLRTGRRQELDSGEVSTPNTTFDFLLPPIDVNAWKLVLMPSPSITRRVISLRVAFSNSTERVVYELVKFHIVSAGTEQVEVESTSPLPFLLSFVLPTSAGREGTVAIRERFEGADVRAVSKALRAFSLLNRGGNIDLYSLDVEKALGRTELTLPKTADQHGWEQVILDATTISELFDVDLRVPTRITEDDVRNLDLLMAIQKNRELPFEALNAKLTKSAEHEAAVLNMGHESLRLLVQFPRLQPAPVVFGTPVHTGPLALRADEANVEGLNDFLARYRAAQYGEGVPIRFLISGVRATRGADLGGHIFAQAQSPER
ncbi:MAG: hypothetical protein ACM3JB_10000 [Acidobacteriaceae bacterium]